MSNHTTIEERNALLDRDVRFARLSLDLEKMGHEVVKRVSQTQPNVEHVAMDAVASWTKKETFAFEPYPHEEAGACSTAQTLFGVRLRHRFAQDVLQALKSSIIPRVEEQCYEFAWCGGSTMVRRFGCSKYEGMYKTNKW